MSSKLAQIDHLAVSQRSFLHAWPTKPKLIATLILLAGIVIANNLRQGILLFCLLLGILFLARLPLWLFGIVFYPAFFSLPFALAKLPVSPAAATAVICKAVSAALLLTLLLASTPFPQLFGAMAKVLPRLVTDSLFFSYRLFFIILGSLERLLLSLRQRGAFARSNFGWSNWVTLHALGYLMVNTLAVSQRLDQNYRLRGYQASVYLGTSSTNWRVIDLALMATLLAVVGGVLWLG